MALFTLDYTTIQEALDYPTAVSEFEQLTEQRRLLSNKKIIGFKFTVDFTIQADMQAYRNEFITATGATTGFTFTSPMDDVTYTVRFVGPMKTLQKNGVFTLSFEFKVINTDEA